MSDLRFFRNRCITRVALFLAEFLLLFFCPGESVHGRQVSGKDSSDLPFSCTRVAQASSDGNGLLQALTADGSALSYARLGQFYLEAGETECARFTLQNALTKDAGLWKARYGLGLVFLQQGDARRAIEELRLVLQQAPQDSMAHNALGLGLETMGEYDSSEHEFKTALDLDPQFDVACFNLAHVLGAQRKYPAVVFYLKKAVDLAPQQPAYRLALGTAYLSSGDFDAAIKCLSELLAAFPDTPGAYFQIGNAYLKQSNSQMAAQSYRQALREDPQNDLARLRLAQALLTGGSDSDAAMVLREYTVRQPRDSQGYYLLGHAYRNLNKLGEARAALEQAAGIKPDDYNIRYELGLVLEHLGLLEPASQQLQLAIHLNPDESQAHYEFSKLLRRLNQNDEANQEFQKFLKLEAKDRDKKKAPALHAQAIAATKQGDVARAISIYREALNLDSSDSQLHYDFALALGEGGDSLAQQFHLQEALKLNPNLIGAQCQLGLLYMNQGKEGDAEGAFRTALDIDPQSVDAQVDLGVLYAREGKQGEAESLFRQAIQNDSKSAAAHANLGLLLVSQNHDVEAEKELKQATQIAPGDAEVLPVLANLQSDLGRLSDSACTLKTLAELQPLSAQTHVQLGITLAALYFYQAALEEFSKATRLGSNPALARLYKGRTLYDLGRTEDARQELQASCTHSPKVAACWYLFALVEQQAKNTPLSIKYLGDTLRLEPQNADAEFLLGQSWFELGKTEEAVDHWKAALQASPDQWRSLYSLVRTGESSRNADAPKYEVRLQDAEQRHHVSDKVGLLSQLAKESAVARDWPAVIAQYQEALRECRHCESAVELHRALGVTYCQVGQLANGERELRIALQLNPDDTRTPQTLRLIRAAEGTHKEWLSLCPHVSPEGQTHPIAADAPR